MSADQGVGDEMNWRVSDEANVHVRVGVKMSLACTANKHQSRAWKIVFKLTDQINDGHKSFVALLRVTVLAKLRHSQGLGVTTNKRGGWWRRVPRQTKVGRGLCHRIIYSKIWLFLKQTGGTARDVILLNIHLEPE
jgi:hypothetical protein